MKSYFTILFLFIIPLSLIGQNYFSSSANTSGIGDCYTTQSNLWSITGNISGLSKLEKTSIGISLRNRFGLKELNIKTAALSLPTRSGVFGISIQQYGYNLYNENKIGLSFSKSLSNTFNSGIKLNYYNNHIEQYENTSIVSFELGIQKELNRELTIGIHLNNPINFNTENTLDNIIAIGLLYKVNPKVNLFTEGESYDYTDLNFKIGAEYQIISNMYFRSGFNSLSEKNTFGFAYSYKKYRIDISTYHHESLGFNSEFSFSTSF